MLFFKKLSSWPKPLEAEPVRPEFGPIDNKGGAIEPNADFLELDEDSKV